MVGVWLRFRAELRTRWRSHLVLAVLVGVAAGAVVAAATGARRTTTAYGRFLSHQRAADLLTGCDHGRQGSEETLAACTEQLVHLPRVLDATRVVAFGPGEVEIRTMAGRGVQPDPNDFGYTGPGEVSLVGSDDGRFGTDLNRIKILAGRHPDPVRRDEVAIPVALATQMHLGVGSELQGTFFDPPPSEDAEPRPRPPVTFRVVGVEAAPYEIAPPSGQFFAVIHVTPALLRDVADKGVMGSGGAGEVALRLKGGASAIDAFRADARQRGVNLATVVVLAEQSKAVTNAIRPQALGLGLLAALLGVAALGILGQALARQAFLEAADHTTLWALGVSRKQLWALGMLRAGTIGAVAGALSTGVAVLLSALTPIGLARTVEPHPGLSVNTAALACGAGATLLLALLLAAVPAWWAARVSATRAETHMRSRPSVVARALARAGAAPPAVTGIRLALERGGGSTAVPVRSTVLSMTLGIGALAAALTFSASIIHLAHTPRLIGWNWDVAAPYPTTPGANEQQPIPLDERVLSSALEAHPDIRAFAFGTLHRPFPNGNHALELGPRRLPIDIISFGGGRGTVAPTVIRGRAPRSPREILLGPKTLDELSLSLGDNVTAVGLVGEWNRPETWRETRARLTIVGTGVIPLVGGEAKLGRGGVLTFQGVKALNPAAAPEVIWLRLAPHAVERKVITDLARSLGIGNEQDITKYLGAGGANAAGEDVLNIQRIHTLPLILAGVVAVLAAGALGHVLVTTVRARRRELAVLKAVGFVRRQMRALIAWEAMALGVVAMLIGLPLGVVAGRWAWRFFAVQLGVVPEPAYPLWPTLVLVPAVIAVANLVAVVPALVAANTHSAAVLTAE